METLYLFSAIFAATFLVAQFLLGLGSDFDHDDGGMDADGDVHDLDDGDHPAHEPRESAGHEHDAPAGHSNSTWVFGVLTLRTVLIGLMFFGLTGKAASVSGFPQPQPLLIAAGCGLAAMYGVYFTMRGLYRLTADGTERIGRSIGEEGMVYLTIPAANGGVGKVHVPVQNRTVEYEAMTAGDTLPTGTRIIVVSVLGSDRVEVEPAVEPARKSNV
ncbi:MAG: hypothetical protein DWQ37_21565 [Planctomycetota bacterium]|nr:MAG: hypothetical protein DWQ37_21565 [Planctomycetota bacterium]